MKSLALLSLAGVICRVSALPTAKTLSLRDTGSASIIIVHVDPARYGCGAGQLAVLDTCQDLDFHVVKATSNGLDEECNATVCAPGQWFDGEHCQSIQIFTDPTQCHENAKAQANQVCVNGVLQTIVTGYDCNSCGPTRQKCGAGQACYEDQCLPITIGSVSFSVGGRSRLEPFLVSTDSTSCGQNNTVCETGSLCLDHGCRSPLDTPVRMDPIQISLDRAQCGDRTTQPCEYDAVCISGVCLSPSDSFTTPYHRQSPKCASPFIGVGTGEHAADKGSTSTAAKQGQPANVDSETHSVDDDTQAHYKAASLFCPAGCLRPSEGELCTKVFGDASSCSGTTCPPQSLCCDGRCLKFTISPPSSGATGLEPQSSARQCPGGCSDGQFCFQGTCYKSEIRPENECSPRGCGAGQACLAVKLCIQVTGDQKSCGKEGRCPANSRCILGACVVVKESQPDHGLETTTSTSLATQTTFETQRPPVSAANVSIATVTSSVTSDVAGIVSVSAPGSSSLAAPAAGNATSILAVPDITTQSQPTPAISPVSVSGNVSSPLTIESVTPQEATASLTDDLQGADITETPLPDLVSSSGEDFLTPSPEPLEAEMTPSDTPLVQVESETPQQALPTPLEPTPTPNEDNSPEEIPSPTPTPEQENSSEEVPGPTPTPEETSSPTPTPEEEEGEGEESPFSTSTESTDSQTPSPSPTEDDAGESTPTPLTGTAGLFQVIDTNNNGLLTLEEFLELGNALCIEFDVEETRLQFEEADVNGDGVLTLTEFVNYMGEIPWEPATFTEGCEPTRNINARALGKVSPRK